MALTRKLLAALGIEAEKIDEIINAHAETVNGLKADIEKEKAKADQYKADADKYEAAQQELDQLKTEAGEKDYDKLKAEFDQYKADVQAKETKSQKEKAYRDALKDANLTDRGIEKAMRYAEWDKIEIDDEGKLKDAKDHVKAVREDWAEYISKVDKTGAATPKPPAGDGGGTPVSRAAEVAKKHYAAVYGKEKK